LRRDFTLIIAGALVVAGIGLCLMNFVMSGPVIIDQPLEVTHQSTDQLPPAVPIVGVGMICIGMVMLCSLAFGMGEVDN